MATAARSLAPVRKSRYVKKGGNGGARPGAGKKPWQPEPKRRERPDQPGVFREETPEEAWQRTRQEVRHYVAIGYPHKVIARLMEPAISEDTLQRHFAYELENGKFIQDAKVAGTGYFMATSGRHGDMTRFWIRSRLGWRDHGDQNVPTAPIQFQLLEGDDW